MTWRRGNLADIKNDVRIASKQEILRRNLSPCVDCGELTRNMLGKVSGASWSRNIERKDVHVTRPGSKLYHFVSRELMKMPGRKINWGRFAHDPRFKVGYRVTRCGRYFAANQGESTSE